MLVLAQRVKEASLYVDGRLIGEMTNGLVVYVCFEKGDTDRNDWLARKILALRVFEDDNGKLNKSVTDIGGGVVLVSNFTLAGDCQKGTRPSFDNAMQYDVAIKHFNDLVSIVKALHNNVIAGTFGADMQVKNIADGPVNVLIK